MDHSEKATRKPGASETAVPAGMMEKMQRAGCCCAEMMPRKMAMCAEADQDADAAEPAETAEPGSEEGINP